MAEELLELPETLEKGMILQRSDGKRRTVGAWSGLLRMAMINGYAIAWESLKWAGWRLVATKPSVARVQLPNGSDGLPCSGPLCRGQIHPFVEPNQPGGRYLCPSCR